MKYGFYIVLCNLCRNWSITSFLDLFCFGYVNIYHSSSCEAIDFWKKSCLGGMSNFSLYVCMCVCVCVCVCVHSGHWGINAPLKNTPSSFLPSPPLNHCVWWWEESSPSGFSGESFPWRFMSKMSRLKHLLCTFVGSWWKFHAELSCFCIVIWWH